MYALDADTALAILRIAVGLVFAAHGAQKVFGVFGGQGLARWMGAVESFGFAQPRVLATLQSFTELFGGLALAAGFYTPVVAGLLAVNMLVATLKVHAKNGPWVTRGGYEYTVVLFVASVALGLAGAEAYSIDAMLALAPSAAVLFLVTFLLAGAVTLVAAMAGGPRAVHGTARS
jgi:putative oxidoreductase